MPIYVTENELGSLQSFDVAVPGLPLMQGQAAGRAFAATYRG